MALDPRWKLPQGKTPDQLYDGLFSLIRELRKGEYLNANVSGKLDVTGSDLLTIDTGLTMIDQAVWDQTVIARFGGNLTEDGTAVAGSANQFGVVIETHVPVTGATANYQKSAAIFIARTADPSTSHDLDVVGLDRRGYIASTNSLGRAWGGVDFVLIEAGGDGLLIGNEIDIVNNGTDQSAVETTTSKYGMLIASSEGPVTAGIFLTGGNVDGGYHHGIYMDPTWVEAGGKFLTLNGVFEVDKAGNIMTAAGLRVGFTGTPGAADRVEVGDANFYLDYAAGTPNLTVDSGDHIRYDRGGDAFIFRPGNTDSAVMVAGVFRPAANDGLALGSTAEGISDLFFASGAVVNWNNGTLTLTQSGSTLDLLGTMRMDALRIDQTPTAVSGAGPIAIGSASTINTRIQVDMNGTTYWIPATTTAF